MKIYWKGTVHTDILYITFGTVLGPFWDRFGTVLGAPFWVLNFPQIWQKPWFLVSFNYIFGKIRNLSEQWTGSAKNQYKPEAIFLTLYTCLYEPVRGEETASLERHSLSLASGLRPAYYWKSIENLLKIYWKPLKIYWKSFENKLKINWKSIENLLNIYWKSIENLRKNIENHLKINWK